jgi:hypothetical protein
MMGKAGNGFPRTARYQNYSIGWGMSLADPIASISVPHDLAEGVSGNRQQTSAISARQHRMSAEERR